MSKKTRTKKQHYIAQCLLGTFLESEKGYECNVNNKKIYKTSINNSMCKSNSYEFILLRDNYLEDFFAKNIDGNSNVIIKQIIKALNEENIERAKTIFKSSSNIFLINYYKSIMSLVHFSGESSKTDISSIANMLARILNVKYINRLSRLLNDEYNFSILRSKSGDFILCDQYFSTCATRFKGSYTNISNREIGLKDTMVLIPLNRFYYILLNNGTLKNFEIKVGEINKMSKSQEKIINCIIYSNAFEKVLAYDDRNLNGVYKKNSNYGDTITSLVFGDGSSKSFKLKQEVFLTNDEYELYEYYTSNNWAKEKFRNVRVNDKCPCGSNIKYKKCCKFKNDKCYSIFKGMHSGRNILINEELGLEDPVQLSNSKIKEMRDLFWKLKQKE